MLSIHNHFDWNNVESSLVWEENRSNGEDHVVEELEKVNVKLLVDSEDVVEDGEHHTGDDWSNLFENGVDRLSSVLGEDETKLHLV